MQRTTHQFQLSDSEFDNIYEQVGLPKEVSKSVALRAVLKRHSELLHQLTNLENELKKLKR